MVCVVYDVSEEATIEKVSERVSVRPGSLPLAPSWSSFCSLLGPQGDAQLMQALG